MKIHAAIVVAAALALGACQTSQLGTKQTAGGLIGAVGGAVVGSNIGGGSGNVAAIAAGTLLGAILGSEIGKSLDNADKAAMAQSTQRSLESNPVGVSTSWSNPDSGNSGTVTPTRTYQASGGQYCREYTQTVQVGGNSEEAYGTACRQPDGTWKIQN
ncbi:RT0821/Lpp0805 family surface protein [Nisaea sp.]|uniref:RT0821/Lpp0805 family surface protein n=1 Tax=Nisaea sp. TaxID=2024842 RepID=UPI003B515632